MFYLVYEKHLWVSPTVDDEHKENEFNVSQRNFCEIISLNLGNKLCRMACPFNFCKNKFLRIGHLEQIAKACIKINTGKFNF